MVSGGCVISGARVHHSLLFSRCRVHSYSEVNDSLILPDVDIGERTNGTRFSQLFGYLGNAQLGPVYLGPWGVLSLLSGSMWFFMVGISFWVQAGFSPG